MSSVALQLSGVSSASGLPSLRLFSGSADGTLVASFDAGVFTPRDFLTDVFRQRYTPASLLTLNPSTTYWLVIEGGSRWRISLGTDLDSGSADGWSINGLAEQRPAASTGGFTPDSDYTFQFGVEGFEVCAFADAGLRAGVEAELGVSAGAQITPQGISGLVRFDLSGASVSDVRGLECAPSLKYVSLDNNGVTDLSPLAGIVKLVSLSLRHNRLSGAVDLAGFHGDDTVYDDERRKGRVGLGPLTVLDLDYNDISSVDVTSLGTNLRSLYVSGNRLSSIDVSSNTDLRRLQLSSNDLTSIDVSALTKLESLYIAKNNLSSLNVSANTKLRWLYIEGNPNLTALNVTGLNSLQTLRTSLAESAITGLTKVGTATHVGTYYHYIDPDLIGGI